MTDEGNNSASRVVSNRDAAVCRPVSTLAIDWMIASRARTSAVGLNGPAARRGDPSPARRGRARTPAALVTPGTMPSARNLGAVAVISLL
jgi:hypothetical protein